MKTTSKVPVVLSPPTACPFCRSPRVLAAGDKIDASTYWRCEGCGEMWNLARLQTSAYRNNYGAKWK
jgi:transposase-like protein